MKILLSSRLTYFPAISGASKGDRALLGALAKRGHQCRVVAIDAAPTELSRGSEAVSGERRFTVNHIEFVAVRRPDQLSAILSAQIGEFRPDCVLVSEDRSFSCLTAALRASDLPVIYVCHSPATLPFGPESFDVDPQSAALLQQVAGIITQSQYMKSYIRRWSGLDSSVMPFPVYGEPPFQSHGRFDQGFVTLVNPSQIKGVEIFKQLAQARPDIDFAAVPTWATGQGDRQALEHLPNLTLLEPSEDIDQILSRTRILLMPSLWGEAFGYLSVEAMLRGIPVLASDLGGLREAKLGVDYLLPVQPIEHYSARLDDRLIPVPSVPAQAFSPWLDALDALLKNHDHYAVISTASREAALAFVASIDLAGFERYFEALIQSPAEKTIG